MILLLILSIIPIGIASEQVESAPVQSSEEYKIFLKSRQFVPTPGVSPSAETKITTSSLERVHVLMQFQHIPNAAERRALEEAGVELLAYVHNNAWFVSMPSSGVAIEEVTSYSVRWIGEILPEDKISPHILEEGVGSWAVNPDGTVNLLVSVFEDVPTDKTKQIISKYGSVVEEPVMSNIWTVTIPNESILDLASEDAVQWIAEVMPPKKTCNDGARQAVGVNTVQAAPYNLHGSNVTIAEWDEGHADRTHPDLGVVVYGDAAGVSDHSTHVAGIAVGDGSLSGGVLRGMADQARLISYEWPDTINEMDTETQLAITNYNASISTNSWGYGVNNTKCGLLGLYDDFSQNYDDIAHGKLGKEILVIFAAGNEQDKPYCGINARGGYDSIAGPGATAKNAITVGATYSDTDGMTCFSSWGPIDDGRIKPDVVAPGDEGDCYWTCDLNPGINSTIPDMVYDDPRVPDCCGPGDDFCYPYDDMVGTSMAAPCVSGSAALLIQDYKNTHDNVDPGPSTIKALLIHTAKDLNNTGPDYTTGYGRINVQDAVDMIRDDAACCNVIIENNISANGEMDNYTIEVPAGTSELKVTLVWTDEPGTPNDGLKELVNDLDLILKDPNGVRKYPWTLNSSNPPEEAERNKRDDLNNVEQVYVSNPIQGTWNITVNGTTVPEPIQNYSLVSSLPMKEEDMSDVAWSIEKGLCWLYHNQNPDGSWSNNVGMTSLAALAFLNAGYDETDPTVQKAIGYILSNVHGDGSIYNSYKTYETSLAILPLVATHNNSYNTTIENAAQWLKDIQWDESCKGGSVNKDNWYYGGFGYHESERPDLSNTQFPLMALDAVLNFSKDDLLWDKAQVFLARDQMRQENVTIPDLGYEVVWDPAYNWNNDGGFVYYPGASLSNTGTSYGSMTAAGIWSLRLCNVPTANTRVQAALDWHKGHYTWTQNPGMTPDGRRFQYYYYLAFSKALMMTVGNQTFDGHDWYADLSANLTGLQHADGHWVNTYTGHGGEGSPELCTAYSILSLQVREIPTEIQRLSWMTLILNSSADLHIYDPLGRHVGKNYDTGGIDIEIPNATYTSNDVQNITVPELEVGNYRIVLIGTETGEYTITVTGGVGDTVVSEDSYTGNITEGEVHDSTVNVAMITWLTIHVEEPEEIDTMVQAATGTGPVYFILEASEIEDLMALNESDMPEENPIVEFPHGLFGFNITGLTPGQNVTLIITFPSDIPTTAQYWKYGPNGSVNNPQPERWYQILMGSNDGDNIITITLQDGGIGDDDGVENGVIVDQGGPGIPRPVCSAEYAIHQAGVPNPDGVLNPLRELRDDHLKDEYVDHYYDYSPELRRVMAKEPGL
ncbi:S8 family serine peptidase, partial [candidate division WOR-3 bacterium]|nr:S8 family serine peptidase [candidate division WOR-3 bacterium]